MIREWISTHTDAKGLEKALREMRSATQKAKEEKPKSEGPSKGDVMRLMKRMGGGAIQRSTRRG